MLGHTGPLEPVVEDPPKVTPPPQPRLETENGEVAGRAAGGGRPDSEQLHLDRPGRGNG